MVHAADIGKASKDFLKKDFFAGNEFKVTQGCCKGTKQTTTFKLGSAVNATHKIEVGSCNYTKLPTTINLGSSTDASTEWTIKSGATKTKLTLGTNLAAAHDISKLSLKKSFEFNKDVSGIATALKLETSAKGTNFIQPINVGLGFEKKGYQFGVTGTIPSITAPAFANPKFAVAFAGCSHFQVSGTTTKGSDWNLNALIKRDGRTYAVEFDTTTMAAAIATELPNGKAKISCDGVLTSYQKFPVSETVAARFGSSFNLSDGKITNIGIGVDFTL